MTARRAAAGTARPVLAFPAFPTNFDGNARAERSVPPPAEAAPTGVRPASAVVHGFGLRSGASERWGMGKDATRARDAARPHAGPRAAALAAALATLVLTGTAARAQENPAAPPPVIEAPAPMSGPAAPAPGPAMTEPGASPSLPAPAPVVAPTAPAQAETPAGASDARAPSPDAAADPTPAPSADAGAPTPAIVPSGIAPAAIAPAAIPAAELPHGDLSPWGMFLAADMVVKSVMMGLAFASLVLDGLSCQERRTPRRQGPAAARPARGARRARADRPRRRAGWSTADLLAAVMVAAARSRSRPRPPRSTPTARPASSTAWPRTSRGSRRASAAG